MDKAKAKEPTKEPEAASEAPPARQAVVVVGPVVVGDAQGATGDISHVKPLRHGMNGVNHEEKT